MSSFVRTLRVASQSRRLALHNSTQLTVRPTLRSSVYANFPSFPVHSFHSSAIAPARAGDPMQGIDPNHPFVQKLRDNPHIVQQLADFTVLLQEKGLDMSSGKQPGFGQIMKLMSDPDIKEKAAKLAQDMQAAGIQMDMNSVMELQKAFGGPRPADDEEQAEKPGLLNKAKGFFKK